MANQNDPKRPALHLRRGGFAEASGRLGDTMGQ